MILYNVTINVEDDRHDEWLQWMQQVHIPKVMASGMFLSYTMYKILSRHEDETGTTYTVQYMAEDMAHFENYRDNHAPALQKETLDMFGNGFSAFRTLLETV